MLVFFYILIIIFVLNLIIYFSSIVLEIEKFKIDTTRKPIIDEYKINIYLTFLNKIKYLKIGISKEKIDKLKNLDLNKIKEKMMKSKVFRKFKEKGLAKKTNEISNVIKKINIKLEKLDIKADIGYSNMAILSYFVAIIDIAVSIFLGKKIGKNLKSQYYSHNNKKQYKYLITPKQTSNLYINANINVIISLKISNIIKISCNLEKIKV